MSDANPEKYPESFLAHIIDPGTRRPWSTLYYSSVYFFVALWMLSVFFSSAPVDALFKGGWVKKNQHQGVVSNLCIKEGQCAALSHVRQTCYWVNEIFIGRVHSMSEISSDELFIYRYGEQVWRALFGHLDEAQYIRNEFLKTTRLRRQSPLWSVRGC